MKMYDPLFCFAKTAPDHKQAPIFSNHIFFCTDLLASTHFIYNQYFDEFVRIYAKVGS